MAHVHITTVYVEKRENPIVNRLNKTKEERQVDHEQERVDRIKKENAIKRVAAAEKVPSRISGITPHLLIRLHQLTRGSKMRNWPNPGKPRKLHDPMTHSSMSKKTMIHHGRLGENWKTISCNFEVSLLSRYLVKCTILPLCGELKSRRMITNLSLDSGEYIENLDNKVTFYPTNKRAVYLCT